jgi:hypothetical protein
MALVSICTMKSLVWLGAMKRKLKDLCYVSSNMSDLSDMSDTSDWEIMF